MNSLVRCLPLLLLLFLSCQGAPVDRVSLSILAYDSDGPADTAVWDLVKQKTAPFADLTVERLSGEAFHQRSDAMASSGQLADLVFLWPAGRSQRLHTGQRLKDLAPLLGDELKDFVPGALEVRAQTGRYLAELPVEISATHVFYVNTALLDTLGLKPATTYGELKAQVPRLRAAGLVPLLMANKDDWVMLSCLFSTVVGRLAGPDFIDEVLSGRATFTDPRFVASLGFVGDLYAEVLPPSSLKTGYGEAPGLFLAGKAAYFIDSDRRIEAMGTNLAFQKNILLTVFPTLVDQPAGAPGTSFIVGPGWGISGALEAGSARERAAVAVLKVLQSREVQQLRWEKGLSYPTREVSNPQATPLEVARAGFYGKHEGSPVLDAVLDPQVFTPLAAGLHELGLGKTTPEEVAARVQKAFEAWKH